MRKPNLLIIGAKKASSTLLFDLLGRHPEVALSAEKEPHYFTSAAYGKRGAWESYLGLFSAAPASARYLTEASTDYTTLPHNGPTPRRIAADLGRPKLLYILRDPVERAISNYRHSYAAGWLPQGTTFGAALRSDPILTDSSCYALQLDAYRNVFGADGVHVVLAEELHQRPAEVMAGVAEYLGLSEITWELPRESVNSHRQVAVASAVRRVIGRGRVARWAKDLLPRGVKDWAKERLPVREPPPIADQDRGSALAALELDLRRLVRELGPRLDLWPSVRGLRPAVPHPVTCRT